MEVSISENQAILYSSETRIFGEALFLSFFFSFMWTIFKVFIEFLTIFFLFSVLVFWPWGMWDLISLTRDQTHTPALEVKWKLLSCPTLCDPMGCTVHGILQARILEKGAFLFSRGYSWPRDQTGVSCISGRFFTSKDTREALPWKGES